MNARPDTQAAPATIRWHEFWPRALEWTGLVSAFLVFVFVLVGAE